MSRRILVIGGAGSVGTRILRLLTGLPETELLIAGRDLDHTNQMADELQERKLPVRAVSVCDIGALRPKLVIDASGPFQNRDYAIPRACIRAGADYLDIADDRDFVIGIDALDAEAIAAGVTVLSGAGMLPSLSMAAASIAAEDFSDITAVRIWFCPGNQQSFGSAACASLLAATGRRFRWRSHGGWRTVRGWQGLRRADFPMLGSRLLAPMNAPDVALLPARWPGLRDATVHGGAELPSLQRGLSLLGWLPRFGASRAMDAFGGFAEGMVRSMSHFGGLDTGLRVMVEGRRDEAALCRSWSLIARGGDGAYLPAAPAAALTRKMLNGHAPPPGARVAAPPLHDILAELRERDIQVRMTETDAGVSEPPWWERWRLQRIWSRRFIPADT